MRANGSTLPHVATPVVPAQLNSFFKNDITIFIVILRPATVANLPISGPSPLSCVLTKVAFKELLNIIWVLLLINFCGFDGLNAFHGKTICCYIINPLLELINKPFNQRIFPNVLKITHYCPFINVMILIN